MTCYEYDCLFVFTISFCFIFFLHMFAFFHHITKHVFFFQHVQKVPPSKSLPSGPANASPVLASGVGGRSEKR